MDGTMTQFDQIETWMTEYMADLLDISTAEVDRTQPFDQLGLDSAASVAFTSDLGRWLNLKLDTSLMVENDTIEAVAAYIRQHFAAPA
ncbi:MAG: acyl carrier protein [Pseudomonadota bacterium]